MRKLALFAVIAGSVAVGACAALAGIDDTYSSVDAAAGTPDASASDAGDATIVDAGATDATIADAPVVVDASGVVYGTAIAVAAGPLHACALTEAGTVYCWGQDAQGQLGNGIVTATPSYPQLLSGLTTRAIAIGSGYYHSCALSEDGGVSCWGDNTHGEILNSTSTTISVPTVVPLPGRASAIALGTVNTCAIIAGDAYCWGDNTYGQCGFVGTGGTIDGGGSTRNPTPTKVAGLPPGGVVSISMNGNPGSAPTAHACAITTTGAAYCWGDRFYQALGDGVGSLHAAQATPVLVAGFDAGVAQIGSGQYHTCAITTDGNAWCWGTNTGGAFGNGSSGGSSPVPGQVDNFSGGISIVAGLYASCAMVDAGGANAITCWGPNNYGQLGNGDSFTDQANTPASSALVGSDVSQLAGAVYETPCAITTGGGVRCWGRSDELQAGTGAVVPLAEGGVATPVAVNGFPQ